MHTIYTVCIYKIIHLCICIYTILYIYNNKHNITGKGSWAHMQQTSSCHAGTRGTEAEPEGRCQLQIFQDPPGQNLSLSSAFLLLHSSAPEKGLWSLCLGLYLFHSSGRDRQKANYIWKCISTNCDKYFKWKLQVIWNNHVLMSW